MIRLVNKKKALVQFNLPHAQCCSGSQCFCDSKEYLVNDRDKSGVMVQKFRTQQLPGSILIPAGATTDPYPDAVLASPDIKGAIARRELVIFRVNNA